MRLVLMLLFVTPLMSFSQESKDVNGLLNRLVSNRYISKGEQQVIKPDSLFKTLWDVHKTGKKARFFRSHKEKNEYINTFVDCFYEFGFIDKYIHLDLKTKYENSNDMNLGSSDKVENINEVIIYLYEYDLYQKSKEERALEKHLHKLAGLGLIPDTASLDIASIKSREDVLALFKSKFIIQVEEIPKSAKEAYSFIFGGIRKLDPSLSISDYRLSTTPGKNGELARISFGKQNYIYATYEGDDRGIDVENIHKKINYFYFRVFNKVLANNGDQSRILDVMGFEENTIAMISLTEKQFDALYEDPFAKRDGYTYFDPEWFEIKISTLYNMFHLLTFAETKNYFSEYDRLGLYSHLTESEKKRKLEEFNGRLMSDPEEMVYSIDGMAFRLGRELESTENPYTLALNQFTSISRGAFTPAEVVDTLTTSGDTVCFEFSFKGRTYKRQFDTTPNTYDPKLIEMIHQSLKDAGYSGRFLRIPDWDKRKGYIYLSKTQYDHLKKNELLKFYEE